MLRDKKILKKKSSTAVMERKIIDFELVKKQFDNNTDLAHEMLGVFLESLSGEEGNLQLAYKKEDWLTIKSIAHKIKGGAIYCGALCLIEICSRIGMSAKDDDKALSHLYNLLLIEIEAVIDAIKFRRY